MPRSLPGVNATASLALGNLKMLEFFPAPPRPFSLPSPQPPCFWPPSPPLVLRTVTFLSCLFPGLMCVEHLCVLGWGLRLQLAARTESCPGGQPGFGSPHQSGPSSLAARLGAPQPPPGLPTVPSALPENLGELNRMPFPAEKPRKASLAFRNQVQISPQGLWGPLQCRPTSCHATAHFWGHCPLPLQKLLSASITNAPSPPSLPLSHLLQVGSRHPLPTLAFLSGLCSQTVEAGPVCPMATAAAPGSAWQAVGAQ